MKSKLGETVRVLRKAWIGLEDGYPHVVGMILGLPIALGVLYFYRFLGLL